MPTRTYEPKPEPVKAHEREISGTSDDVDIPVVNPPTPESIDSLMRDLAFMEEEVEVYVPPSNDPHDSVRFVGPVCVNGTCIYLARDSWSKIKRKYLGVLLSSYADSWTFTADQVNGQAKNREFSVKVPRFNITSVRDNNPLGEKWMRSIQQSPF